MFDKVNFIFNGSESTGYGQHAKFFGESLKKLLPPQKEGKECTIVLSTVNSGDFFQNYNGTKIAFCVWESTLFPDDFFKQLLTFDQLWVPSKWQKDCAVKQGFPEDRVKVVPEGVDGSIYKFIGRSDSRGSFTFLHIGKWEDRKSSKEIVETFLRTFPKESYPNIKLKLSVDNPFPVDGMTTTKERFQKYGFNDDRLESIPYIDKETYIKNLQSADCFVTCARSEGWNLPLIEAIACGTPSICSKYSAQIEFHNIPELQVNIKEHKKPVNVYGMPDCPGTWSEPDYNDLSLKMFDSYIRRDQYQNLFMNQRDLFVEKWSWENTAKIAINELEELSKLEPINQETVFFNYHFVKGAFIEIKGSSTSTYDIIFKNLDNGEVLFTTRMKANHWCKASIEYYMNYGITVLDNNKVVFEHKYNCKDRKVFVNFESSSIGDTIAWFPYVEEFRKKHGCKMVVSTFQNFFFEKTYPEIEFVKPGEVVNDIYAQYSIGVYHQDREWKNPRDWRTVPLQRISSDILGIDYKEIRPVLDMSNVYTANVKRPKKYVCISEHSTAMCKYWHYPNGWQILVDKLIKSGYNVAAISKESSGLKGVIKTNGNHIDITMGNLAGCDFYIGLASGLAWLAWAMGKPVVMISGFSAPFVEFKSNNIRIAGKGDCTACLNDIFIHDRAWDEGCFHNKDFSCTRDITPDEIMDSISKLIGDMKSEVKHPLDYTTAPILRNSNRQTSFKKYLELIHNNFSNPNLIEIGTVRRVPTDPDLPGDGNSTSVFSWYVKNYNGSLTAIDIAEESIKNCKETLDSQGLLSNVNLICQDGLEFLKTYDKPINGIYIDGLDWFRDDLIKQKESEEFHLTALKEAERNLVVGSIVMFDDCFDNDFTGKGRLAIPYAINSGNYELIYQGYQVILKKNK